MRDFLEFLRRPRFSFAMLALILFLLFFGVWILRSRLSWFALNTENLSFWKSDEKAGLFVPSPLEAYLLDSREEIWPDTFNPRRPLKVGEIPVFYTQVSSQNRWDILSPIEFEEARQWSVLANSEHIEELRALLKKPDPAAIRAEKECSPLMQETLYRISQAWPENLKEVQAYFARCAPKGVHLLWWDLQAALKSEDPQALKAIGQKFQEGMNTFPGQWSRWFALEAYQIAHVMAARITEP